MSSSLPGITIVPTSGVRDRLAEFSSIVGTASADRFREPVIRPKKL